MKKFVIVKSCDPLQFLTPEIKLDSEYKNAWKLSLENGEQILQALTKSNALSFPPSSLLVVKAEIFYRTNKKPL